MSKKIIISEREKNRISELHTRRILMERNGGKVETTEQDATATPTTQTTTAAPAPTTQTTTAAPTPTRYTTAVCPAGKPKCDQSVLRIQIRMNDECPDMSQTKLIEDGIFGSKTTSAWSSCKTKLKPTKTTGSTQTNQSTGTQQTGQPQNVAIGGGQPEIDTKISANDIATLTAK